VATFFNEQKKSFSESIDEVDWRSVMVPIEQLEIEDNNAGATLLTFLERLEQESNSLPNNCCRDTNWQLESVVRM